MSAPVVPDLGSNTNARKYIPEFDLNDNLLSPLWTPCGGVKSFVPVTDNAQNQDDRRYSDSGYGRMNKTGTDWTATLTFSRAPQLADSTLYDPVQEFLRLRGEQKLGSAAECNMRWYEFNSDATLPRVQAYQGRALVSYNEPNGGPLDNSDGTVTFQGQGKLSPVSHPYPVTPQVPLITNATPRTAGTAGGSAIVISGQHFAGTTGVTVGTTAVTNFTVLSDSTIVATVPAKTAGAQALVVTNATGASTTGGVITYA